MVRKGQSAKEKALRRYFTKSGRGLKSPSILLGSAVLLTALITKAGGSNNSITFPIFVGIIAIAWFALASRRRIASEAEVDAAWAFAYSNCLQASYSKLDMELPSAGGGYSGNAQVRVDPKTVCGPILWKTHGIPGADLLYRRNRQGYVRFAINRITIVHLEEYRMGVYACDYNLLREVALNEETLEYHYQDVVSVATKEESTSYILPTGAKLAMSKLFRIAITNGEFVQLVIGSDELLTATKGSELPPSGADAAVQAIRTRLRDRKRPSGF